MWNHIQPHNLVFILLICSYPCNTDLALNQISVLNLSAASSTETGVENGLNNRQSKLSVKHKTELKIEENHTNKESTGQTSRRSVDALLVNKVNQPKEIRSQ